MHLTAADILHELLLYGILPTWILAGFGDYLCHRTTRISTTSGVKESLLHWLMVLELGIPILLAMFFEITGLVLAIMLIGLVLHYVTSLWDLRVAYHSPRDLLPIEQHIHSYQEMLPIFGFICVVVVHWKQALALLGLGPQPADFSLRYTPYYWETGYAPWLLGAVVCFVLVPYGEELLRCLRHRKAGMRTVPYRIFGRSPAT
jgi:hypothetical protein